jgi:hypothetical protein
MAQVAAGAEMAEAATASKYESAQQAKGIAGKVFNAAGHVAQLKQAIQDNKIGRYSAGYEQSIANANLDAVASAASYIYARPNNATGNLTQGYLDSNMPGYELDRNLSDSEHIVLVNDSTKQVKVAFRGTDVGTYADLEADVQLATHGRDYDGIPRFDRALNRFEQAQRKFDGYEFTVTGHSLGGSQAMWVARHHPTVKAKVFNPGITGLTSKQATHTGGRNLINRMFHMRDKNEGMEFNNIEILRMDGDIVSSGYASRVGYDATLEDGEKVNDKRSLTRPYGKNGAKLTNAKFSNDSKGLAWTLKAHALQNFLTEEQSLEYRDLAKISKDMYVYGDKDGNSATGNVHFQPADVKLESHTQTTGHKRTGNAYHEDREMHHKAHKARVASLDI